MTTGTFLADDAFLVPPDVGGLDRFVPWVQSEDCPEHKRISLVNGEIHVEMSPEKIKPHNWVKTDLATDLGVWCRSRNLGRVFADGALLVNEAAGLSTEPDLMFCSWPTLRTRRVRFAEDTADGGVEVTGSPDMVLEVVSNSSVSKDTRHLPKQYFAAKIKEYWLVDARGAEWEFSIFRRGRTKYNAVSADEEGFLYSRVLQAKFCLVRKPNPVGDFECRLTGQDMETK